MKIWRISINFQKSILSAMIFVISSSAFACFAPAPMELRDIINADLIIEGTVTRYEFVVTEETRRNKERLLARYKSQNEEERWEELKNKALVSYALLTIRVERVLTGNAPGEITITWKNSTFELPETLDASLQIFAIRDPRKGHPSLPLRAPSGLILPAPEPDKLTLLQAPCSDAFMFDAGGDTGRAIAEAFNGVGNPVEKLELYLRTPPRQSLKRSVPPALALDREGGRKLLGVIKN